MYLINFNMEIRSLGIAFFQLVAATALLYPAYAFAQTQGSSNFNPDEYLELRGKYRLGGVWRFNLYNKDMQGSKWLQVGQRTGNFKIQSYDPESEKLTIDMDGATGVLGLAKAKEPSGTSSVTSVGGSSISATNLRFKNGLYYELGKEDSPFTEAPPKSILLASHGTNAATKAARSTAPRSSGSPMARRSTRCFTQRISEQVSGPTGIKRGKLPPNASTRRTSLSKICL